MYFLHLTKYLKTGNPALSQNDKLTDVDVISSCCDDEEYKGYISPQSRKYMDCISCCVLLDLDLLQLVCFFSG